MRVGFVRTDWRWSRVSLTGGGGDGVGPAVWQLLAVVPVTVLVVAALTMIPARVGARRSVAEVLQSERA